MCIRDRPTNALAQGESAQGYVADPRNDGVLVYVNGDFVPRDEARVSIFDSGFVLGDGIWEGLRLVQGRIISLDAHLDRLYEGATSIALDIGLTRAELTQALLDTLAKNAMTDGAHIRLMVTRGVKRTPNQDPRFVIGKATVVIVAEFKTPKPEAKARGFVASCNSTNFFIVRQGELWTSTGAYSFKGITQRNVIDAWTAAGSVARECDFTLAQVYSADEAFVTGTLGGVTPVTKVDGRTIGDGRPGAQTIRAGELYLQSVASERQRAPRRNSAIW